jgi:hypothetical protein
MSDIWVPPPTGGDDTALIQKCVDDAGASTVRLSPGTYTVSSAIIFESGGGRFIGCGGGGNVAPGSRIRTTNPAADVLAVYGQAMTFSDFAIDSAVPRLGGSGIMLDGQGGSSQGHRIERLWMEKMCIGIDSRRAAYVNFERNFIRVSCRDGVGIWLRNTNSRGDENVGVIAHNQIFGLDDAHTSGYGILHNAGGGTRYIGNAIFGFYSSLVLEPSGVQNQMTLSEFEIIGNELDVQGGACSLRLGGPGSAVGIKIVGNHITDVAHRPGYNGIVIYGEIGAVAITGNVVTVHGEGSRAVNVFQQSGRAPGNVLVTGNVMTSDGTALSGVCGAGTVYVMSNVIAGFKQRTEHVTVDTGNVG